MPYQPGEILINKYRIEASLGHGAFGEVYRVTNLALNVTRALKVMRRDAPGLGTIEFGKYKSRFQFEAQLGARLNTPAANPHLLQVHSYEEKGKLLLLEMEYASGGSLAKRIVELKKQGGTMPIEAAVQMGMEVAQGLSALHELDIVHRDLKPSNILFDQTGHARLADLGLAQAPGSDSLRSQLSNSKPHPGTPAYMSPEQHDLRDYLLPASDVYALGLVLFEVLTGRVYRSQRPGTHAGELMRGIPDWLDDLLVRMLAENPKERPWNGQEAATLLQEGLEEETTKRKADAARQEAKEKALQEQQARQKSGAEEKSRREAEERQRQETEIKTRQAAQEQAQREAQELERRQAEQRTAEKARLQREIETALARQEWRKAKQLISKLKNQGPDGRVIADRLRERFPKTKIPVWAWAVPVAFVLITLLALGASGKLGAARPVAVPTPTLTFAAGFTPTITPMATPTSTPIPTSTFTTTPTLTPTATPTQVLIFSSIPVGCNEIIGYGWRGMGYPDKCLAIPQTSECPYIEIDDRYCQCKDFFGYTANVEWDECKIIGFPNAPAPLILKLP
jgi:serine/threonine protein kinase